MRKSSVILMSAVAIGGLLLTSLRAETLALQEVEELATAMLMGVSLSLDVPMPTTATAPPCEPDCALTVNTKGPFLVTNVNLANGCIVDIYYYTKHYSCGGLYYDEIDITDVKIKNNCTKLLSEILDQAAEELLENPAAVGLGNLQNPIPGQCITSYRVSKGQCWEAHPTEPWRYVVCPVAECCRADYTLCRDLAGDLTVTKTNSVAAQTNNCGDEGCFSVCD